jgi:hypothetical protein
MIVDANHKQVEVVREVMRHRCAHALLESDDHTFAVVR